MAHEWRPIDRVLHILLLPGERDREFIQIYAQGRLYLETVPQPLMDVATLVLHTGLWLDRCWETPSAIFTGNCGKL